jgi:hypothetical protein
MSQGWIPCFPARGLQPAFDVVLVKDETTLRVQVKRAYKMYSEKRDATYLHAYVRSRKQKMYDPVDVNMIAIVHPESGRIWLAPNDGSIPPQVQLTTGRYDHWLVRDGHET